MGGTPYERSFEVTVDADHIEFELRYRSRGTLRTLTLTQQTGALEGVRVTIYNSEKALAAVSASSLSSATPGDPAYGPGAYYVHHADLPPGQSFLAQTDLWAGFINRDGGPSNLQRRLYVRFTNIGTGEKIFQLKLLSEGPDF